MTSTAQQPTWLDALSQFLDELRRLDLKIHNDTHLEPAPTSSHDQVHSSIWSKTRLTSRGAVIAELEYSGCLRFWYQDNNRPPTTANQPTTVPAGLDAGPTPAK